jgi:hypothetical protein
MARILKASLLYFAIVFGCGFVLGTIRMLWLVPRIGTRGAELLETPIMLVISALAAGWTARRLAIPYRSSARLTMGGGALALLLVAEFGFVLWIRGLTIREYLSTRDPVAGIVYYIALGIFAIMPLVVSRRPTKSSAPA